MSDPIPQIPYDLPPPPDVPATPAQPRRRGLVAGAIVLVVALLGGAAAFVVTQVGGSAEAQPLALRFTEGQSETYEITTTVDGHIASDLMGEFPLDVEMTQVVTWSVVSVDEEGLATVEVGTSEVSGSVSGMEIPQEETTTPPVELVIAPDGRVVSIGGMPLGPLGDMQGFGGFPGMGQLTPILPDDGAAVAPGDTWTKEFSQEMPVGEGSIDVVAESRYDRNEDVDGREAAVIVTELTVPIEFSFDLDDLAGLAEEMGATPTGMPELGDAAMSLSGSGAFTQTSFVDLDAQELLRSESSGEIDIVMDVTGVPGYEGPTTITAAFTQDLERR